MKEFIRHNPYYDNMGGSTIVIHQTNDGQTIYIAKSLCSEKDQYSKKIGRTVCRERIRNNQTIDGWCKMLTIDEAKAFLVDNITSNNFSNMMNKKIVSVIDSFTCFSINGLFELAERFLDGKPLYKEYQW